MTLKYMDFPLDRAERAQKHLRNAIRHALNYPDQRFNEDAFIELKVQILDICDFWNTSLHDYFHDWKIAKERCRNKEKYKLAVDLGRRARGKDYRILDYECSLYYACLIHAADAELEFRLNLVHSCVEWVKAHHNAAVRPDKIGRRIMLKKSMWPFPKYEPNMVRVRRTRPGVRIPLDPEFPRKPDPFNSKDDIGNIFCED